MSYTQSQLTQAGYGLRPDPEKDAEAYSRWLAAVSRAGKILENKRFATRSHGATTISAASRGGSASIAKTGAASILETPPAGHSMTAQSNVSYLPAAWWAGSVLTGAPPYDSTSAIFNVPAGIPGGDGTTITQIVVWNGLGGYGYNSGLIQGGVVVTTTPTFATIFPTR